ncbi:polyphosphate kinase 2 family protein [Paenibacillus sp. CC-CFT747]|nr:polyphosphate kinase 2 family protein [Paenibacillus sp. CC-CFT747]
MQEKLYAGKEKAVLFLFQGMDTSGKDGVIRKAFAGVNPQGFRVHSFKAPTAEEAAHDFLWRAHQLIPARGYMAAFNRSYYEDVLITRVHGQVSDAEAKRRLKHIRHFEELLADSGVVLVKIFLHISKEFQLEKLKDRIVNPEKNWKFDPNDLVERKSWEAYQRCYEEVFENSGTPDAPWHLVPADNRKYRDWAVLRIAVEKLEGMNLNFPAPYPELQKFLPEIEREQKTPKKSPPPPKRCSSPVT